MSRKIHKTAHVSKLALIKPLARIGADSKIKARTIIHRNAVIGSCVFVGEDCFVGPDAVIGHDSRLADGSRVPTGVKFTGELPEGMPVPDTYHDNGARGFACGKFGYYRWFAWRDKDGVAWLKFGCETNTANYWLTAGNARRLAECHAAGEVVVHMQVTIALATLANALAVAH